MLRLTESAKIFNLENFRLYGDEEDVLMDVPTQCLICMFVHFLVETHLNRFTISSRNTENKK